MARMIRPKDKDAMISGITMKKLKIPMYTPMRAAGIAPDKMAYGIERMEAHAMPTPTIVTSSTHLSWMKYTDSRPTPPQISEIACTVLRLVAVANFGSRKAMAKQTIE